MASWSLPSEILLIVSGQEENLICLTEKAVFCVLGSLSSLRKCKQLVKLILKDVEAIPWDL